MLPRESFIKSYMLQFNFYSKTDISMERAQIRQFVVYFLFCSGRGKQISCLNKWHRNFRIMSKYNNKLLWENYLPDCNWHNECFLPPLMHVVRSFQSMPINLFKNDHFITLFGEEKKYCAKIVSIWLIYSKIASYSFQTHNHLLKNSFVALNIIAEHTWST